MNLNSLTDLYRHMEWADASVWAAVFANEAGQTDEKLRDYLYHLHMVQRAFLRLWRGVPPDTPYPTFADAPSLLEWARSYYAEAFAYLATLSDEALAAPMPLPWATMIEKQLGRPPAVSTVGETALQVPLHSLYHRGQVNARLRALGGETPLVDYIAWVWMDRPASNWQPLAPPGE